MLALASCSEQPRPDARQIVRTEAVDAKAEELEGLTRLENLDAASSWSLLNDGQLVAYASPHSEGIAWVMPGLRCPSETFAAATKVEIGVSHPDSATLARALAAHNRRVANNPSHKGECLASSED